MKKSIPILAQQYSYGKNDSRKESYCKAAFWIPILENHAKACGQPHRANGVDDIGVVFSYDTETREDNGKYSQSSKSKTPKHIPSSFHKNCL